MKPNAQFRTVNGEGRPRVIVVKSTYIHTSVAGNSTYTATTANESGSPTYVNVRAGMRVRSFVTGTPDRETWAKILSVSGVTTKVLTVDEWTNGTPTNGRLFYVDGYVVDLPYTKKQEETFEPDILEHGVYRGDQGTVMLSEFRGWKYQCELDYAQRILADELIDLAPALALGLNDTMFLMPHKDKKGYVYNVYYGGSVDIGLFGISGGHSGVRLKFKGVQNTPSFPIPTSGYGFGFGANYGIQL